MELLDALPVIGPVVETGLNMINQGAANRQNTKMWIQNRKWAEADWDKQNAYNSPKAQMQRYKDAGLNPNLIYGQSNTAGPVRSNDTPRVQPVQSQGTADSMLKGFLSMYDLQKTQAETDRLKRQAELIEAERRLKEQQTKNMGFDLFKGQSLLPPTLEGMALKNRNMGADYNLKGIVGENMIQDNARKWLMAGNTLTETAQKILESRARTSNLGLEQGMIHQKIEQLKKQNTLSDLEISLKNKGFTWSDPAYIRLGSRLIDEYLKGNPLEGILHDHSGEEIKVGNSKAKWHFR